MSQKHIMQYNTVLHSGSSETLGFAAQGFLLSFHYTAKVRKKWKRLY